MSAVKTTKQIELMQEGGKILGNILSVLLGEVKVGTVPLAIDNKAKLIIAEAGGTPSFMTVRGYHWATCISVNDVVVHGIPTRKPFKSGDVVGIDVGILYKGYHTDTSWSVYLKNGSEVHDREREKFLKTGEIALERAIAEAKPGKYVGHISRAIQVTVESSGYSVVRSLVGHGVGKTLHETPQIPGIVTRPIDKTVPLEVGMVLAIEVIYTMGGSDIMYKNNDGWTLSTKDGSVSGLFEHTIAITQKGPIILTQR